MIRRVFTSTLLTLASCGTLEVPAVGNTDLPNNRTGPFRVLSDDDLEGRRCINESLESDIEDPEITNGTQGEFWIFSSRVTGARSEITRGVLTRALTLREAPTPVLPGVDDARSPSVVRDGEGWRMLFARGGRVEVADSDDGERWRARSTPVLVADPGAGERTNLSGPSLTEDPDGRWTLAYESAGSVWIARAPRPDGPFERVDVDPSRAGRQPALAASAEAPVIAHANPVIRSERLSTGRTVWRIYARTTAARVVDGGTTTEQTLSLAASYDGVRFTVATAPALSGRGEPQPDAPGVLFDGPTRSLLLFSGGCGGGRRGVRAAIYPAEARLPLTR